MKFSFVAALLLVGSAQGVQLSAEGLLGKRGIPKEDLMEGNHWRKPWPEGDVDATGKHDASEDEPIISEYNVPLPRKKEKPAPNRPMWVTYEPHTTTGMDQFQDRFH